MIDLLNQLSTDARLRADKNHARKATPWRPSFPASEAPLPPRGAAPSSLAATTDGAETAREAGSSLVSLPRALICITTETFCTNCGERYRSPNYAIMAEYGPNNVSINRTMDDVCRLDRICGPLPREHRTLTVHAPACERCF